MTYTNTTPILTARKTLPTVLATFAVWGFCLVLMAS